MSDSDSFRPTAAQIMQILGLEPDPWQLDVLEGNHKRLLLNCCRQAGKSTVVALLSLLQAMHNPGALILLLSRSLRQSTELFRRVLDFHRRVKFVLLERKTAHELILKTQSRIISLPCADDTIRGFAGVHMLVIDEASRVPDKLYRAVRPMLAVSHGRLVCLSTPHGCRGFFYDAWAHGGPDWHRIQVPGSAVARIGPEFLAEERRCLGDVYFRQEYECSFEAPEGLVYPDFARCVVPADAIPVGRKVGGLDFGFRNPFAAVWGVVDRDDVLWLTGEHYARQQPLSYHARQLPRDVRWYADPAGATEISELRCAGFAVCKGTSAIEAGIAAVSARLQNGTLRVLAGRCPNLLREAALYRYGGAEGGRHSEKPVDEDNHALAALRYLVSRIDARRMARFLRREPPAEGEPEPPAETKPPKKKWLSMYNEFLWERLY
jgi:hypothetical protein